MSARKIPAHKHRRPHAQLHLPALTAEQARLLVRVLERAIEAVYRAHGEAMFDLCEAHSDPPPLTTLYNSAPLPDDFPF